MRIITPLIMLSLVIAASECVSEQVQPFNVSKSPGLNVVDAEDGKWDIISVPSLSEAGVTAIRNRPNITPPSKYLYFQFTPEMRRTLGSEVYLVVDFLDDGFGMAGLEYNSQQSPYTVGNGFLQLSTGKWRKALLHITDAQFNGLQNGNADFRLSGQLTIAGVEVYRQKPDIVLTSNEERLKDLLSKTPARTDMFYTFGNDADETSALLYRSLGVTSIESYVTWETCERAGEGEWDWTRWDNQVRVLKGSELKWAPFLILGPAYSTPDWFRKSKEHVPCSCLEHGTDSKIESLWNPNLPKRIDRFIREFAKRYGDTGVIESVLLGVQGDFGEAIYSVTGAGWSFDIPGEYHNHAGYWCNDPYALADFRKCMTRRYKTIDALNKAWGTDYASIGKASFPGKGDELQRFQAKVGNRDPQARRRWIDFIDWYRDSMTRWSDWWMATTRKYFPKTPIYLCTGGDAEPMHGSNFAEQCRIAAKHGAGIRITNEGNSYPVNFTLTRWVASAGKHYGSYFGFEPAAPLDDEAVVARVYNATASGANQLMCYTPDIVSTQKRIDLQRKHFRYLFHVSNPQTPIALWYPNVSLTLRWGGFLEQAAQMRDLTDIDYVDESMLHTGALDHHKILVILHGDVMETSDAGKIAEWVRRGGQLIVMDVENIESVEGAPDPEQIIFGDSPHGRTLGKGKVVRVNGWDNLAAQLRKDLGDLNLPVYDLRMDGVFGTQIAQDRFLFLNTTSSNVQETICATHSAKTITIKHGTITDVKL